MNGSYNPFSHPLMISRDFSREYQDWLAKQKLQQAANEELKQRQQAEAQKLSLKKLLSP